MSATARRVVTGGRSVLFCILLLATTADGATFVVDTTLDLRDATPGDGQCSDGAGRCALRGAIMEANALSGADDIELPPGIYALTIAGADENACGRGDLDITQPLTLRGAGPDATWIDAAGLNPPDRVLHITAATTLEGVTIRGGNVSGGGGGLSAGWGGGIATTGDVELRNCTVADNTAQLGGGGVCFVRGSGYHTLTASQCAIRNNRALGHNGGGIGQEYGAEFSVDGVFQLNDCAVTENSAAGSGGGIYGSELELTATHVEHNTATGDGGGIAWFHSSSNDPDRWLRCKIAHNHADGNGGGVFASNLWYSSLSVEQCEIRENTCDGDGGGLWWSTNGWFWQSTAVGNSAGGAGGGLYIDFPIVLWMATISGNSADGDGGGIYRKAPMSQYTPKGFQGVTITQNIADADADGTGAGGGVYNTGPPADFKYSILAGNFVGTSAIGTADCGKASSATVTFTGCVIGVGDGCGIPATCLTDNCVGNNAAPREPGLEPLGDYGGPTPTHALRFDSPAIDRGMSSDYMWTSDQRGIHRPQDGDGDGTAENDAGATEFINCNENNRDDGVDIALGLSADCNANTVPDSCDAVAGGDFDADGAFDADDYTVLTDALSGPSNPSGENPVCWPTYLAAFDLDADNDIDLADFAWLQLLAPR